MFRIILKTNSMKPFVFVKEMQCVHREVGNKHLFFLIIYTLIFIYVFKVVCFMRDDGPQDGNM